MFLRGPEFRIEYLFPGKSIKYKKNYNNNKKKGVQQISFHPNTQNCSKNRISFSKIMHHDENCGARC